MLIILNYTFLYQSKWTSLFFIYQLDCLSFKSFFFSFSLYKFSSLLHSLFFLGISVHYIIRKFCWVQFCCIISSTMGQKSQIKVSHLHPLPLFFRYFWGFLYDEQPHLEGQKLSFFLHPTLCYINKFSFTQFLETLSIKRKISIFLWDEEILLLVFLICVFWYFIISSLKSSVCDEFIKRKNVNLFIYVHIYTIQKVFFSILYRYLVFH